MRKVMISRIISRLGVHPEQRNRVLIKTVIIMRA